MRMWEHPLHKMQAGLALLLPLWSEPALVLPPRCADFGCGHGGCLQPAPPHASVHLSNQQVV